MKTDYSECKVCFSPLQLTSYSNGFLGGTYVFVLSVTSYAPNFEAVKWHFGLGLSFCLCLCIMLALGQE